MANIEQDNNNAIISSRGGGGRGDSGNGDEDNSVRKSPSYRILIVDDEADIAFIYKTVLEEAGFNVDVFNDPISALSKIKDVYSSPFPNPSSTTNASTGTAVATPSSKLYDLLLLDIRMPEMNGFELYEEIKKTIKNKDIKVCFITAYEVYYEILKQELPKIDVGCFIKKPIDANDLVKRIKEELSLEE
jgi:two-component system catabolic regulation response regulator CreB/two-component system response regulator ChvI